jgi:hypothetical protein
MTPLTLSFMETCYQSCCFGNEEPTHIAMSDRRKEELRRLITDLTFLPEELKKQWEVTGGPLRYNNAEVVSRSTFTDYHVHFVNVFRPDSPHWSRLFEIRD